MVSSVFNIFSFVLHRRKKIYRFHIQPVNFLEAMVLTLFVSKTKCFGDNPPIILSYFVVSLEVALMGPDSLIERDPAYSFNNICFCLLCQWHTLLPRKHHLQHANTWAEPATGLQRLLQQCRPTGVCESHTCENPPPRPVPHPRCHGSFPPSLLRRGRDHHQRQVRDQQHSDTCQPQSSITRHNLPFSPP